MIDLHLLKHYLKTILDIDITPRPWTAAEQLPFYLRTAYAFYQINILGVDCLLAFDENPATASPATISKHLAQIKIKWTGDVIYVRSAVSAGYRNRMIRQKIPFIIPNNQMFLPMFGMDIREYFKKIKITPVALSPSAQCLILFLLIRGYSPGSMITLRHVAQSMGYSLMTISRVFDELTALELAQSVREGRDRKLRVLFPAVKLWEKSLPYLTTPVQQRVILSSLDTDIPISLAGLSALAEYTMLSAPEYSTGAIFNRDWNRFKHHLLIHSIPYTETGSREIEIWKYSPGLFAVNNIVDRLSLYLSLNGNDDERIETALEEVMKDVVW